jgi:hypothetical protein
MWSLRCHATCTIARGEICRDATQRFRLRCMTTHVPPCRAGSGARKRLWASRNGHAPCCCSPRDPRLRPLPDRSSDGNGMCASGPGAFSLRVWRGCTIKNARAASPFFPPEGALSVVKLACERPDVVGRSLAQWDRAELARPLGHDGVVEAISPQTVQRILLHHTRKPWRYHRWWSPQVPRDAAFAAQVHEIVTRYTRPLGVGEMGLCVDEKTSLPPRTRKAPTWAAQPGKPVRVEPTYTRKGALHLLAGFDPRTGKGYATTAERKRQGECIAFLEPVDHAIAAHITLMHGVLDNLRRHKGKQVQAWLAKHPRFRCHFPPVHGSWMHQVEQWCSSLQRKRRQIAAFTDKKPLAERLLAFVAEWNTPAHPLRWSTKSVAKVMATCENTVAKAA